MVFLDRPLGVWIVLAALAFGGISTLEALARSLNTGPTYSLPMTGLGLASAILSLWLCSEIWNKGPRMVKIARGLLGVILLPYLLILLSSVAADASEAALAALFLAIFMAAVYGAIYAYVVRYSRILGLPK